MQPLLAPPSLGDVISLIAYVLQDPYLFIGSTTVMTTGLVVGTGVLAAATVFAAPLSRPLAHTSGRVLDWLAPRLALLLAYFGAGSMALATQIFLRFHGDLPAETTMQLRSGIGHLVVGALGILVLVPRLRALSGPTWIEAHFWALAYLTVHVLVLTPPWFGFQGQMDLVLGWARALLVAALAANVVLWEAMRRRA